MNASRTLTAAVHQEEDWYVAQCLEVDVASQGRTIREALDSLAEAVELWVTSFRLPDAAVVEDLPAGATDAETLR